MQQKNKKKGMDIAHLTGCTEWMHGLQKAIYKAS